jgi:hypothetical protein
VYSFGVLKLHTERDMVEEDSMFFQDGCSEVVLSSIGGDFAVILDGISQDCSKL